MSSGSSRGSCVAGVVIVSLLVDPTDRPSRSYVPYGPFLIIGALWAILGPR